MLPSSQTPVRTLVARIVPKSSETGGSDAFFLVFIGSFVTRDQHDMMTQFLKLKPTRFLQSEIKILMSLSLTIF